MDQIKIEQAEKQIIEMQKTVDYDTKEFTVEILVNKYSQGMDNDENEIFIPYYQRHFVWDKERQSKFIESVLLGLPIPFIFTADMEDGRLEIVDGTQRIRTLHEFLTNKLILKNLKTLDAANNFKFEDFPVARQRKFRNTTLRMVVISDKSDEDVRFLMFERINTGSDILKKMESRKALKQGPFTKFLIESVENPDFQRLTSFSELAKKRLADVELILRFFALSDKFDDYSGNMNEFLNKYLDEKNKGFDKKEYSSRLNRTLKFVSKYMQEGLKKSSGAVKTPQARFEAISVGVYRALENNRKLNPKNLEWIDSDEFTFHSSSGKSVNSINRVKNRIDFVTQELLK